MKARKRRGTIGPLPRFCNFVFHSEYDYTLDCSKRLGSEQIYMQNFQDKTLIRYSPNAHTPEMKIKPKYSS